MTGLMRRGCYTGSCTLQGCECHCGSTCDLYVDVHVMSGTDPTRGSQLPGTRLRAVTVEHQALQPSCVWKTKALGFQSTHSTIAASSAVTGMQGDEAMHAAVWEFT